MTLLGSGEIRNLSMFGVHATADTTNRRATLAEATLLSQAGGSHRLIVNKHASAHTASLVLRDNFSGRAETGLAGDDRQAELSAKPAA